MQNLSARVMHRPKLWLTGNEKKITLRKRREFNRLYDFWFVTTPPLPKKKPHQPPHWDLTQSDWVRSMCTTFSSFCLNSFACTHPPINSITTEEFCFYRMQCSSTVKTENTIVLFLHLLKFKYHLLNESCFSRDIYKLQVPGSGRCTMRGSGGGAESRGFGKSKIFKFT